MEPNASSKCSLVSIVIMHTSENFLMFNFRRELMKRSLLNYQTLKSRLEA